MKIKNYSKTRNNLIKRLNIIKDIIQHIETEFGLEKTDLNILKDKLSNSIQDLKDKLFTIALFGAFSDGKSTVISALTNNMDIEIAPKPTTDKIKNYDYKNFKIIDTPGLFSDKLLHDNKTKNYISRANLILYVLDSVNPLKNSHHNTIKWLINDLNKEKAIIFVLNKMEYVSDLDDDEDFNRNKNIKMEVVNNTLRQILGEEINTSIVCIAANPFEKGLDYWIKNKKEYYKLSRIGKIEKIINQHINQEKNNLILNAGISSIKDVKNKLVHKLGKIKKGYKKQINLYNNQIEELENKISTLRQDVNEKHNNIRIGIINYREDLLKLFDSCTDVSDLKAKIQQKVGEDGYILEEHINNLIQKYTKGLYNQQKDFIENIEKSTEYYSDLSEKVLKGMTKAGGTIGKKILAKSPRTLANGILKSRNALKIPIKFKPWGAIKWAKRLSKFGKFLKALPLLAESLEAITVFRKEHKLNKELNNIKNQLEDLFKTFLKSFTIEDYIEKYAPAIIDSEKLLNQYIENKNKYKDFLERLDKAKDKLDFEIKDL